MSKTLWVLGNNEEAACLVDLWEELEARDKKFYLAGAPQALDKKIKEKNWLKKIFPSLANIRLAVKISLVLLWPVFVLVGFFYFWFLKKKLNITKIIFLSALDYGFWIWPARLAGIKVGWLLLSPPKRQNKLARLAAKLQKRSASIMVFNELAREKLKIAGFSEKIIKIIKPGINLDRLRRQEDIFSQLAEADDKYGRKFFVVGTVLTGSEPRLEPLLIAGQKSLAAIPNLQIIIIGDAGERKKVAWLAEKMNLGTAVWFVGRPNYLNKYLEHFDIYAPVCPEAGWRDMALVLLAQACGVPVVCPEGIGLDEIVKHNKTGLILAGEESEELAQAIIKLKQNLFQRRRLSQTEREEVRKNYTAAAMADNFLSSLHP